MKNSTILSGSLIVLLLGTTLCCCAEDDPVEAGDSGDSDIDGDTDSDSDGDGDSDTDTDSDSDSDGDNYDDNEDGAYQDMLTPEYYLSGDGDSFRDDVNKFINFARQEQFRHPLEDDSSQIPSYVVEKSFGDGTGPGDTSEHHPADDLHVGDNETSVTAYAAHGGLVSTYKDAPMYRHYLSISRDIVDGDGLLLGKLVTLYAHLDLDLDEAAGLHMDGQTVATGDVVSKNLYSGTVGGPHLHFEIRYYRADDIGDETYYGSSDGPAADPSLTEPSEGPWAYGYWNPEVGFGFGNPPNHGLIL